MPIPWEGIAGGIAGGFALVWRIYDSIKERRLTRQYGLDDNPGRCRDHDLAIVGLQKDIESIKEDIREIKGRLP